MAVKKINNRWYYEFMIFGIRKHGACRGCNDRSSALEYEAEIKEELSLIHRGKKTSESLITIKEMFELFLEYSKANNKEKTIKVNESRIDFFKEYFGEKTKITEITPAKIEELKIYLTKKNDKSNSTFNRYYATLSKAFNLVITEKKLNMINPCKLVKKLKEDNEKIRYLTPEEEKRLMDELSEHLKPIVICALTTGLRLSNILNLRWEAIDIKQNFIEILKQENKGHKQIKLPIAPKFKKELKKIGIKKEGYVFINPDTNKPYTTIKTGFKRALERAGIENFRFHDLRHTVGTRLVANGADLMTVKEFLAHSQITTTQRYMHPTPENMLNAIDILNNF